MLLDQVSFRGRAPGRYIATPVEATRPELWTCGWIPGWLADEFRSGTMVVGPDRIYKR